jgi:RNA recognition motif-containing protein
MSKDDIFDMFKTCGKISSVKLNRPLEYGFVQFFKCEATLETIVKVTFKTVFTFRR